MSVFFGEDCTPATGFRQLDQLPLMTRLTVLRLLEAGQFTAGSPAFTE